MHAFACTHAHTHTHTRTLTHVRAHAHTKAHTKAHARTRTQRTQHAPGGVVESVTVWLPPSACTARSPNRTAPRSVARTVRPDSTVPLLPDAWGGGMGGGSDRGNSS